MKLLKRLSFLLLLSLAVGAFWGYKQGYTLQDVEDYISDFFTNEDADQLEGEHEKPENDSATPPGGKGETASLPKKKVPELQPLPPNPFARIDKYARSSTAANEKNVQTLADYLEKGAQNDMEKTRAIYVWLTKNISYDWEEYTSGLIGSYSAEEILGRRKAVCGGFASLFLALGEAMGLEVQKVVGYAKGFGYSQGDKFHDTNHAWNIAKIDGEWKIFDATWGEGYAEVINGKTVTTKEFEDYWFDVPPYEAIFSRLPKKRNLSFVEPLLSLSGFEKLPYVEKTYFKIGFDGKEAFNAVRSNDILRFPAFYHVKTHVEVNEAPKYEVLETNNTYKFDFYVPRGFSVVLIDSENKWTYLENKQGRFWKPYQPRAKGKLQLSIKHEKSGGSYQTLMEYWVREVKSPG